MGWTYGEELDAGDVGLDHVVAEREQVVAQVQVPRVDLYRSTRQNRSERGCGCEGMDLEDEDELEEGEDGGEDDRVDVHHTPRRLPREKQNP